MAATALSDIIVPEVFAPYIVEQATEKSEIIASGIAQRTPEFDKKASSEGLIVEMPFWDDLTGDSEVLLLGREEIAGGHTAPPSRLAQAQKFLTTGTQWTNMVGTEKSLTSSRAKAWQTDA